MYFAIRYSNHRRVGLWLMEELKGLDIYPRNLEGEPLVGLWRKTRVFGGEKKPIINRKIRYIDEEIQKALDNDQDNRLTVLLYLKRNWPRSKTFLHISYV